MSEANSPDVPIRPYFRRDQTDGISAPDLTKVCSYADHIVHARGKRTRFTSVSLDLGTIRAFGEASYRLKRDEIEADHHQLVEHESLLAELRRAVTTGDKDVRLKALQALRYAGMRKEGLVDWRFDIARVERKDAITWAYHHVQKYFVRL